LELKEKIRKTRVKKSELKTQLDNNKQQLHIHIEQNKQDLYKLRKELWAAEKAFDD